MKINPTGEPRRSNMQTMTAEEIAVLELMWQIEKLGGSAKLTKAVTLLSEVRDTLADHIEGIK